MNANIKQYFVVGANGVRHTITMRKDEPEQKLSVYPPPKLAVVQGRVTRSNFDLFVKRWSDYRDMSNVHDTRLHNRLSEGWPGGGGRQDHQREVWG